MTYRWIVLCLALGPIPGLAETPVSKPDCYCTDRQGARVELGERICLTVDGRSFIALCDMSLNNPTWRDTGTPCVSSGLFERLERLQPPLDPGAVHTPV